MDYQLNKKYLFLNGSILKIIACAVMLIDHFGVAIISFLLQNMENGSEQYQSMYLFYRILRDIGRTGFPIFCFLLVEGFYHTRNRAKYALRLFAFALISEIPFDFSLFGELTWEYQNVFWTLLIGLLTIYALDWLKGFIKVEHVDLKSRSNQFLAILGFVGTIIIGCGMAYLLKTDYSFIGVILILIFYFFKSSPIVAGVIGYLSFLFEPFCLPAFVLIQFYNGKRGFEHVKFNYKYFFYWFYPVHLLILYFIRMIAMG